MASPPEGTLSFGRELFMCDYMMGANGNVFRVLLTLNYISDKSFSFRKSSFIMPYPMCYKFSKYVEII